MSPYMRAYRAGVKLAQQEHFGKVANTEQGEVEEEPLYFRDNEFAEPQAPTPDDQLDEFFGNLDDRGMKGDALQSLMAQAEEYGDRTGNYNPSLDDLTQTISNDDLAGRLSMLEALINSDKFDSATEDERERVYASYARYDKEQERRRSNPQQAPALASSPEPDFTDDPDFIRTGRGELVPLPSIIEDARPQASAEEAYNFTQEEVNRFNAEQDATPAAAPVQPRAPAGGRPAAEMRRDLLGDEPNMTPNREPTFIERLQASSNRVRNQAAPAPETPRFDYGLAADVDEDARFNVQAGNYRKQFNRFRSQFGDDEQAFQGLNYRDFAGALGNRGLRVGDSLSASDIMSRLQSIRQNKYNRQQGQSVGNIYAGNQLGIQNQRGRNVNRGSLAQQRAAAQRNRPTSTPTTSPQLNNQLPSPKQMAVGLSQFMGYDGSNPSAARQVPYGSMNTRQLAGSLPKFRSSEQPYKNANPQALNTADMFKFKPQGNVNNATN